MYIWLMEAIKKGMSYSEALKALNEGKVVSRKNWPAGLLVFKDNGRSVPDQITEHLEARGKTLKLKNEMVMADSNGKGMSWNPSQADTFGSDWQIMGTPEAETALEDTSSQNGEGKEDGNGEGSGPDITPSLN